MVCGIDKFFLLVIGRVLYFCCFKYVKFFFVEKLFKEEGIDDFRDFFRMCEEIREEDVQEEKEDCVDCG